jgi:uncharacterized membrane protein
VVPLGRWSRNRAAPPGCRKEPTLPHTQATAKPHKRREVYIDAFRGLMALIMVQGHVFETLLSPSARADALYQVQLLFHGSTAPGFLFASGFVAGLPRAPLSLKASARRARRLLFVLAVGYFLHLPYYSFWKTLTATPVERAALFACDALQVIAVTQLFVLLLQWMVGTRWTMVAGALLVPLLIAGPFVWSSGVSSHFHPALAAYLDARSGSHFPVFPYSAFVLAGTVAGAALGRQEARTRRRRAQLFGFLLIVVGTALAWLLSGHVDFWGVSPAYVLIRIGGLLLLLRLVESAAEREWPGIPSLALIGHETLQVFVLHLVLLYGGVLITTPLTPWVGRLGFGATSAVMIAMLPLLFVAAWAWHRLKIRAPHEATLTLAFISTAFVIEYLTRPW